MVLLVAGAQPVELHCTVRLVLWHVLIVFHCVVQGQGTRHYRSVSFSDLGVPYLQVE